MIKIAYFPHCSKSIPTVLPQKDKIYRIETIKINRSIHLDLCGLYSFCLKIQIGLLADFQVNESKMKDRKTLNNGRFVVTVTHYCYYFFFQLPIEFGFRTGWQCRWMFIDYFGPFAVAKRKFQNIEHMHKHKQTHTHTHLSTWWLFNIFISFIAHMNIDRSLREHDLFDGFDWIGCKWFQNWLPPIDCHIFDIDSITNHGIIDMIDFAKNTHTSHYTCHIKKNSKWNRISLIAEKFVDVKADASRNCSFGSKSS